MKNRLTRIVLAASLTLLCFGCVKKVSVAKKLPVNAPLSTEELLNRVESYGEVKTFSAQAELHVRNYLTGDGAKAEDYPEATGLIRLQRPGNIRMRVTFLGAQVADMVSDGQQFRLAIYRPKDKRQFVYGSNLTSYERLDAEDIREAKDPRVAEAGGLINMRPQHFTDAFLIKTNFERDRIECFREEVEQDERHSEPGKKSGMVRRTYSVLYVLERNGGGLLELRRKYWFDRTRNNTPLTRQQTFDNGFGKVASDVTYSDWFRAPGTEQLWPRKVSVDRRNDGYRIDLTLEKESLEINAALPDTAFVLENTEGLKEVNLDAPRKASAAPGRKPPTVLTVR